MLLRKPRQTQVRAVVAPNQHSRALSIEGKVATAFDRVHRRQGRTVGFDNVEEVRAMRATAAASATVPIVH